ncbi:MAG TPA: GNAT family N-acetyltransferase [Candidatus Acidoferrales bacterium]|jgi:GNAT superfamily N-acetyltransferase|nr:GNAT family N-acetyltransferase [Candidatus Acidoferrales bacterium]
MEIRIAGPELWPQIREGVLELLRELGQEADDLGDFDAARFEREWRADPERMRALVALDDAGSLAAVATLAQSFAIYAGGRYGILLEMYVKRAHRSKGLGAELLRRAVAYGRSRGWSRIEVTAPEGNQWSRTVAFYERNGFRYAGPKLKIPIE